jgi:hypothetical protein
VQIANTSTYITIVDENVGISCDSRNGACQVVINLPEKYDIISKPDGVRFHVFAHIFNIETACKHILGL